jgi:DNA-binding CsgD family transcriptional regulator
MIRNILLNKREGLTYVEIAEYRNVSFKTIKKQMGKALFILRKKLKDKIKPILFLLLEPDLYSKHPALNS